MITWDPPWPCWSDSYLLPMLPITMPCHSFTSMDSPTMMSELSNILWKPPWFDKAVLLELCSTLSKPSSLRPPTWASHQSSVSQHLLALLGQAGLHPLI
jgi:hypothetical protein